MIQTGADPKNDLIKKYNLKYCKYKGNEFFCSPCGKHIYLFSGLWWEKKEPHLIKGKHNKYGNYAISVFSKSVYVKNLIAHCFLDKFYNGDNFKIIHINQITTDNRAENLKYVNKEGYSKYLSRLHRSREYKRENYKTSKITYSDALKIAERLDKGETLKALAKEFNTSDMSIFRIRKRYCKNKRVCIHADKNTRDKAKQLFFKMSTLEVSKKLNISYERAWNWLKQYKKELEKSDPEKLNNIIQIQDKFSYDLKLKKVEHMRAKRAETIKKDSKKELKKIASKMFNNFHLKDISRILNISYGTVYLWKQKHDKNTLLSNEN